VPLFTAFTLFQPAVYSAVGVADPATLLAPAATSAEMTTSFVLESSPSFTVRRSV
jgi:hypothetical protein